MNKTHLELEKELTDRINQLSPIVNGLENHEPFRQLLKLWSDTERIADSSWHLLQDPAKLNELRITKFSALALVNAVPNMKHELEKLQEELIKLRNPDLMILKDVDND